MYVGHLMAELQFGSVGHSTRNPSTHELTVSAQRMRQPRSITSTAAKAIHRLSMPRMTIGQNASLCAAAAAPAPNKPAVISVWRWPRKAKPASTNSAAKPPNIEVRTVLITAKPPALSLLLEGRRRFGVVLPEQARLQDFDLHPRRHFHLGVAIPNLYQLTDQTALGDHAIPLLQ